jgi:hypothetical protein
MLCKCRGDGALALRACKSGLVTALVTWVLQANLRDQPFLVRLQAALDELGEDWHAVEIMPFVPELPTLPFTAEARAIVCYGPSFVPRVAAAPAWRPGIFFEAATFRWSAMAAAWGDLMFSPDGAVATVFDALEALAREPLFVRPDEDSKSFDGGAFADAATLRAQLGSTPLETPAIVARVRAVDAEWRCFVVNGGRDRFLGVSTRGAAVPPSRRAAAGAGARRTGSGAVGAIGCDVHRHRVERRSLRHRRGELLQRGTLLCVRSRDGCRRRRTARSFVLRAKVAVLAVSSIRAGTLGGVSDLRRQRAGAMDRGR